MKRKTETSSRTRLWVVVGLALAIAGILGVKSLVPKSQTVGELPQETLKRALEENQPTLAFFHSLNCDPCIRSMEVVDEVMPAFEDSIVLVDVNVSDTANHDLLRSASVRTIPAFYLFDGQGEVQVFYGVPQVDELRAALNELEGGG